MAPFARDPTVQIEKKQVLYALSYDEDEIFAYNFVDPAMLQKMLLLLVLAEHTDAYKKNLLSYEKSSVSKMRLWHFEMYYDFVLLLPPESRNAL